MYDIKDLKDIQDFQDMAEVLTLTAWNYLWHWGYHGCVWGWHWCRAPWQPQQGVPGPSPPPQTISALVAFELYSVTIETLMHSLSCAELDLGLLNNPNKTAANPFIQLSPWGKTIRTENLWVVQWKWLNKMHDDHYKFHVTGKIVFSRENPCGVSWKWRFGSLWIQVNVGDWNVSHNYLAQV